jgi:hypothetical protein
MEFREIQNECDERKYNSSILARTDMAGKMDYCKDCIFRNDLPQCELNHEIRKTYSICARNYNKLKEKENGRKKRNNRTN